MAIGLNIGSFNRIGSGSSEDLRVTTWVNNIVAAGGSVSSSTRTAINAFVNGCKTDGIWTKLSSGLLLPFASDSLTGVETALCIPAGKTTARTGFSAGDYSLNTGLDCTSSNSSRRISTTTVLSDIATSTSVQISVYTNIVRNASNPTIYIGSGNGAQACILFKNFNNANFFDSFNNTTARITTSTGAATAGLTSGMRRSASDTEIRVNGSSTVTGTASGGTFPASDPITVFAYYNGSSYTLWDTSRHCYVYIGPALTSAEESLHYARVQALQTSLGRQV